MIIKRSSLFVASNDVFGGLIIQKSVSKPSSKRAVIFLKFSVKINHISLLTIVSVGNAYFLGDSNEVLVGIIPKICKSEAISIFT